MYIKSFQIKEIKAFANVKFDFGKGDQYAGWNVFVGGNASGKSTILKGMALALAGPVEGRVLLPTTQGWLRYSAASGAIDLELVFDKEHDSFKGKGAIPIGPFFAGVQWQKPSKDDQLPIFEANKKSRSPLKIAERSLWNTNASGWFCAGYGPMRRLTGTSADAIRFTLAGGVISRFLTLFREDAALTESEEWLKKEHARSLEQKTNSQSAQLLENVTNFLNDGLLPNTMKISKVTVDQVLLSNQEGLELPMRDLSDGCRSVYALILDLIHSFAEVYGVEGLFTKNPDSPWQINKPGVVLIDEVEAHLHPVWQQTLPEWLKSRFPLVQFIVTTHSPLIVQAASPGGIYVLPLQNEPKSGSLLPFQPDIADFFLNDPEKAKKPFRTLFQVLGL